MKNVLKPLSKTALILWALTATVSATDATIHINILRLRMTTLIIVNEEMNDIMKVHEKINKNIMKVPWIRLFIDKRC